MPEIITFCGYRCDLCPAYNKNKGILATDQEICDGWKKYLEYAVTPEQISCAGCRNIGKHVDSDCPVRPCILKKKLETCADCEEYETCEKLHSRADAIELIKKKFEGKLSEKEYTLFLRPYEGRRRLETLRKK